ncbi:integrase core domain protein [Colletotrichum incanum]|nr:integrase core domain protein [Colletotrichum incanum]
MSQRMLLALRPTLELENKYPKDILLYIIKLLYGLAESGLYWYKTYLEYYKNDLGITESTYDLCLLYITEGPDNFSITAMQTDDTLSFVTAPFSQKEEEELVRKGLRAKLKTIMSQS